MSYCTGCYPTFQANQLAHAEPGGCCYFAETEELCIPTNLSPQFDACVEKEDDASVSSLGTGIGASISASISASAVECCICYEMIGKKNNCTTECGHQFCFKCLATAMARSNACPCCRAKLVDEAEDSEDEEDYVDEGEDDEEDDENDEDDGPWPDGMDVDKNYDGDVEDVLERIQQKGYTMLDMVCLLFNKFSKKDERYTPEYIKTLCDTVDQINIDVGQESVEMELMGDEDHGV